MKAKPFVLPEEVPQLNDEIASITAELDENDADRERAVAIVREADDHDEQLSALHQRRAEHRAAAFIDGTEADMHALDDELEAMEKTGRAIREQASAALIAIELLGAKHVELEARLAATREERTQLAVACLGARRDAAFQRFLEAIEALEPIVTDASAADRIINRLCGTGGDMGPALLAGIRDCRFGCEPWLWQRLANSAEPCRFPVGWLYVHEDTRMCEDQDKVDALERLMIDAQLLAPPLPPPPPPTPEERAARKAAEAQERAKEDARIRETLLNGPVVTLSYPDHPEMGKKILSQRVLPSSGAPSRISNGPTPRGG